MSFWTDVFGPRRTFDGGLFLPDCKSETARLPIETVAAEGPLRVPLQAMRTLPTRPCVRVGQRVLAGQPLAEAATVDSVPVHAPTSGTITAFEKVWTAVDGILPGVCLEPDGEDRTMQPSIGWEEESFIFHLAGMGVVSAAPRQAAHRLIQDAIAAGVTDLIVNAMETEPYLTTDLRLLVEQPGRLVDAACEIADAMGVQRVLFALPFRHRRLIRQIEVETSGRSVEAVPLSNKYPQCHPVVLIRTLLDREVPPGGRDVDCGALVLSVATVAAISDATLDDRPVTHAVVTVGGELTERPGTYRIPIGLPIRRLAEHVGLTEPNAMTISGGPLTGVAVDRDDAVVTADTVGILFLTPPPRPDPVPCVHCGWCVEDCPVGLDPTALMQLDGQADCDPMDSFRLRACVDCGLCSYVCPANLPIAATIRRCRNRLVEDAPPVEAGTRP